MNSRALSAGPQSTQAFFLLNVFLLIIGKEHPKKRILGKLQWIDHFVPGVRVALQRRWPMTRVLRDEWVGLVVSRGRGHFRHRESNVQRREGEKQYGKATSFIFLGLK